MHDDELRLLIRDAIERHLGAAFGERAVPTDGHRGDSRCDGSGALDGRTGAPSPALSWKTHLSHGRFVFLAPNEPDAPCVVEPEVRCHHCGFCQSYGH